MVYLSLANGTYKVQRKGVLRNFAKFAGKHLCQSHFFNIGAGTAQVLSYEFCEISKNTTSYRTTLVAASVYFEFIGIPYTSLFWNVPWKPQFAIVRNNGIKRL